MRFRVCKMFTRHTETLHCTVYLLSTTKPCTTKRRNTPFRVAAFRGSLALGKSLVSGCEAFSAFRVPRAPTAQRLCIPRRFVARHTNAKGLRPLLAKLKSLATQKTEATIQALSFAFLKLWLLKDRTPTETKQPSKPKRKAPTKSKSRKKA